MIQPKKRLVFRRLAAAAALLALSGCAAISALGDASRPLDVYELRPPEAIAPVRRAVPRDVIVELPTTSGALSTDRIMIRPDPLQAQYLPDVRWSEPTPVMVQTLMLRTIEATQAVRYVGRRPLGPGGDYAIVTEVVDFQAELGADGDSAEVRLRIIVRLVREADARIVASRTFVAEALSPSTETRSVIEAFDVASERLLADFAEWIPGVLGAR
ncbi:ABC-type transport auxiliary lipoprotein family protein [Aestuariicoccus sp. MJ-SS9]|uniref:ABC-type transport auxiliary lipoprotein family protein n=1 Tax=Aestuariicoccus sp. MJ-SS9 TaxID=3079855 RepID=UPI00290D2F41|nr:ABC-type transport auxiliary lipoprotein family protein [Aestuariicoccus sp. MJ-SS9]MDU8913373.1 ABC-type transport auxiliary lipoprotein family protein [Aestuariicoccus sp. MJ-SS9]